MEPESFAPRRNKKTNNSSLMLWVWAALLPVITWYAYSNFRANINWVNYYPSAYYELLTEAITSGQTHLKLQPDARLKELSNPWGGGQGIPRAHDATYFNNRYYLYFGVGPVILLYAPWRILTGTYLSDGAGTGLFCTAGFLLAVWFYLRCRRRFFMHLNPFWVFIVILSLGLGSFVQFELRSSEFYHVPISCAFFCAMVVAHAMFLAALAKSWQLQVFWVAIGCTAAAVAVGSRPNFLIALISTLGGVLILWLNWVRVRGFWSKPSQGVMYAAVIPVAIIGSFLAAYNYIRFGDLKEFGIRYQFAAVDMRNMQLLSPDFIKHAFEGYFLAGREYTAYYPFIRQTTENIGLLYWAPFALLAVFFPLTMLVPELRSRAWVLGVGMLLASSLANLVTLLFYYYVFDRYVMDFLPAMMLVALITFSILLNDIGLRGKLKNAAILLFGSLLIYTFVHSFIHGLPAGLAWPEIQRVARVLNRIPYYFERWNGFEYGGMEARINFKRGEIDVKEPVVVTGGGRDLVYVKYIGAHRAQFGFFHMGAGGPLSEEFDFVEGKEYKLKVDLGSMYPPASHGVYAGWSPGEIAALLRRVEVRLDDRIMLKFSSSMHQNEPSKVIFGRNHDTITDGLFRGKLSSIRRLGIPQLDAIRAETGDGPVSITMRFPPFVATFAQPLLSTGRMGAGDIVYVFYEGPNRVRFAHDCWGRDLVQTESVYYDPSIDQRVEIDLPNLHANIIDPLAGRDHLIIRFNGRTLYDKARKAHPIAPGEFYVGNNAINSSSAEHNFNGPKLEYARLKELPPAATDGAVYMKIKLPKLRIGRSEPLVVTGENGAGEIVYIKFLDEKYIQIGYDKWNYGGPLSVPVMCDDATELELEISFGSLYSAKQYLSDIDFEVGFNSTPQALIVRANGYQILNYPVQSYFNKNKRVVFGLNTIRASTCTERFTGEMLRVERIGIIKLK